MLGLRRCLKAAFALRIMYICFRHFTYSKARERMYTPGPENASSETVVRSVATHIKRLVSFQP